MKSREALEQLTYYANLIKKDLRILEILKDNEVNISLVKKFIYYDEDGYALYRLSPGCCDLTEDEFELLKGWLRNE